MFDIKDSDMENASSIMDESSSSFLLNEDSISSMDIDINALEKVSPALPGEPQKKTQFPMEDDEDGDDHPRTIILANSQDKFVLDQDVCKSCGSFGLGEEGKLIVCTQCGQCYHPYCASVKVTKVILQKGWRCLDCTVCEGCGKPHDEGRLLLCDECDIRFHIYCLDPPLDHVPKGTWKCKWCVMCVNCGTTTPGFGCNWQNDYTQCGPCRSKIDCPVCLHKYHEDEMIIQCLQCNRWLHAQCDGLHPEDDVERAADYDYQCLFCRPKTGKDGPSVQEVKKLWSLERGTGYTVGKVSHFNVTDTDIRSLYGTTCRWVTDQVMDAYLACIVQREVEKGNHVTMYPSQTMKSIVEGTFSTQKCRQKLKLWECSTVIGAVFQNCHWTLVIIDLRSRILTFMNPKQEGRSQLDEINRNWCAYIKERRQIYKEVKLEGSSWSVQTWKHSRQTDAFNCGVYCLIFADRYFLKEPLTNITNDSLSRAREEIAASLMMQNVWQEKCCPTCGFNTYDEEVIRCEKCFSHFHKTEACVGLENMARRTFTCQICSKKCVEETKRKLETHEDQIVEENENMKKVKSTTEEVKVMEDVQSHGTCLNNAEITATAPRNSFFTNRKVFLKDCCPKCAKTIEDEESIKCSTCRRSFHFKPFCIEEDLADIKEAEYFKCRLCRINFWENQEEDHQDLRKHPLKKRKRSSFLHSDIHGRYQQEERKGSSKDEPFSGPKERHVSLKSFYEKINQITCKIINCSNNDCKEEDHKRHHQFILDIDMFLQKERRNYGFGNDYIDAEQQEILIQEMLQLFLLKKHTPGRIYSGWWMSIVGLENNKILESIFKSNILSAKDYIIHVLVKEIIIYLIMDTTGICYQMADKRCRSTE